MKRRYVLLGDCLVTGIYAPPPGCLVLRETDPAEALADPGKPPLLARPLNYVRVSSTVRTPGLDA